MSDFSFVGTAQCERCGEFLSSSDEECSECSPEDLKRYHFEHISDDDIEVTWSVNPVRAWHDLMDTVDDPLPWRCVETGHMSVDMAQFGHDVQKIYEEGN